MLQDMPRVWLAGLVKAINEYLLLGRHFRIGVIVPRYFLVNLIQAVHGSSATFFNSLTGHRCEHKSLPVLLAAPPIYCTEIFTKPITLT